VRVIILGVCECVYSSCHQEEKKIEKVEYNNNHKQRKIDSTIKSSSTCCWLFFCCTWNFYFYLSSLVPLNQMISRLNYFLMFNMRKGIFMNVIIPPLTLKFFCLVVQRSFEDSSVVIELLVMKH
jgi:hypothetical protein